MRCPARSVVHSLVSTYAFRMYCPPIHLLLFTCCVFVHTISYSRNSLPLFARSARCVRVRMRIAFHLFFFIAVTFPLAASPSAPFCCAFVRSRPRARAAPPVYVCVHITVSLIWYRIPAATALPFTH